MVLKLETLESIKIAHPFNKGFDKLHTCQNDDEAHRIAKGEFLKPGSNLGKGTKPSTANIEEVKEEGENAAPADGETSKPEETVEVYTTTYYVGLEINPEAKRIDVSWPTEEFYSMCRNSQSFDENVNSIHITLIKK